jgi:C4-dicarboxylate transporter, DcuC family
MMLIAAGLIIAGAVYLIVRRVEVRLVLLGAGLLMALVAGKPLAIADTFTRAMVMGFVGPICAALGFAAVLALTGCDQHLVLLLVTPLRRVRWLVVPGGILTAYLVNLAIPSQTSTAAALGPVLVPLMLAAGVRPEVAGAALVLGASFGGDLLSPAAQDVQSLVAVGLSASAIGARVIPASLAGAVVAAVSFALLQKRSLKYGAQTPENDQPVATPHAVLHTPHAKGLRLNPVKALIPLVPIALLLLAYYLKVRLAERSPLAWLLEMPPAAAEATARGYEWRRLESALPVVRAMLIGTLLAAAVSWREIQQVTRSLFEGMGAAYGNIISLTITAQCFGAGIEAIGVSEALLRLLGGSPSALAVLSGGFPWALAVLSGSGSGPIQTFAQTFLAPLATRPDAATLGAISCLAGAFGRTMSPVAAVVIYSSGLVGVPPIVLVRRLVPALLAGAAVALATVLVRG